nr:MAG: zinc-binding loop region of homing endonuclease [Bacteriophage sp.]
MTTKYSNIKGYPGYYISKRGILLLSLKRVGVKGKGEGRKGTTTVISNTWRKKYVSLKSNGYLQCTLFRKRFYIHRLVYEAWIGNIPNGYDIDHINGIKTDNRVSNLRAVSRSENLKHNYELGFKGSNYIHTFSDKERNLIMIDHKEKGLSIKKISIKYGYSRYFIHRVLKGVR